MPMPDVKEPNAKASQVLDGALSTFLELGFDGASVDEIARRAKVSKPTLYNHFADKRALFAAVIRRACSEYSARIFDVDLATAGIEAQLLVVGERMTSAAVTPFAQSVFRLVVASSAQFPELGRVFYTSGPDLGARRLAVLLGAAVGRGELKIDDVEAAAHQFIDLCRGDCFFRGLFRVVDEIPDAEVARVVARAVSTFMRAYRP